MARKPRKRAPLPVPALVVAPDAWPANDIEQRPTALLVPYARNARTHSDRQVREIAGLIARFGWTAPILVDERDGIIAGHGRVMAANLLNLVEVPVVVARGWSAADIAAYCIADNKVAENAGWDKQLLALELRALADMPDFSGQLAGLGFTTAELTRLLPAQEFAGHTNADDAGAGADVGPVISRPGDIWLLDGHRVMCGDATNADHVAALFAGDRPSLMATDPPYGVDYDPEWRADVGELIRSTGDNRACGLVANDDRADWRAAWELFDGDVAYVWHAAMFGPEVLASLEACDFERRCLIVWNKVKHAIGRGHYHWKHESCWYVVRKGRESHWQGSRTENTVWDIAPNGGESTGHGTQKPIECFKRPIKNNSKPGDFVYDPFSGSGTTIIAGEMLARRVLAMETVPDYVDLAVRRWERFTKKRAILAAGELEMAAVAAARAVETQSAAA